MQDMKKNSAIEINLSENIKSTKNNVGATPAFQDPHITINEQYPIIINKSSSILRKRNNQNQNDIISSRRLIVKDNSASNIIPSGFRGTVNIENKYFTKSLQSQMSNKDNSISMGQTQNSKTNADTTNEHDTPNSYVAVTKSVTGTMDNYEGLSEDSKNFQSTFYTKSSSCGYFTFSCNIVYGKNGRSKICRPKIPTKENC